MPCTEDAGVQEGRVIVNQESQRDKMNAKQFMTQNESQTAKREFWNDYSLFCGLLVIYKLNLWKTLLETAILLTTGMCSTEAQAASVLLLQQYMQVAKYATSVQQLRREFDGSNRLRDWSWQVYQYRIRFIELIQVRQAFIGWTTHTAREIAMPSHFAPDAWPLLLLPIAR